MKNSKKLFIVAMSMIMIIATIIPSFALTTDEYLRVPPDDLGTTSWDNWSYYNTGLHKFYIVIDTTLLTEGSTNITFLFARDENLIASAQRIIQISYSNNIISYDLYNDIYDTYNEYMFVATPRLNIEVQSTKLYIPVYAFNACPDQRVMPEFCQYYLSTTTSTSDLQREAFEVGYQNGYVDGYLEGVVDSADIQRNLNLVEHCEQLLGTFVGDDYAHYITPLCLALVVILVYFLFIRWLLALVKSKNVTRVADIIVCTACIIMLVIMYAPMLDLTIKQAQTVYQIAADTVVGG